MPRIITDGMGTEREVPQNGFTSISQQTPKDKPAWREMVAEHQGRQEFREAIDDSQREISVYIPTDKWIMVAMSGDKHIGSQGFDWARFQRDSELILDTPEAFEIDLGDIVDNLFFNVHEDVFNITEQVNLVNGWAKEMLDRGKMICTVGGNHQEWVSKIGIEFYMLVTGFNGFVPYMREGGFLDLQVGEAVYKFRLDHKTKYNSDLNPHHTNHRSFWMVAQDCDVIASAHSHSNTAEQWNLRGRSDEERTVTFVKTGSMKKRDRYKDQNGFIPDWQTGGPCVLLNPKSKEVLISQNVPQGIKMLESLNRN